MVLETHTKGAMAPTRTISSGAMLPGSTGVVVGQRIAQTDDGKTVSKGARSAESALHCASC